MSWAEQIFTSRDNAFSARIHKAQTHQDYIRLQRQRNRFAAALTARTSEVAKTMVSALGAYRRMCCNPDKRQYVDDMRTIGHRNFDYALVRYMLELSGFDEDGMELWFEAARGNEFIVTSDGVFCAVSSTTTCDQCDDVCYITDDFKDVYIAPGGYGAWRKLQCWCESCCDNYSFYCEYSNATYSANDFVESTSDCDTAICAEWAERNGMYDTEDGWSNDDPEDTPDDDIPEYHDSYRNWSYEISNRSLRSFFGYEIELKFEEYGKVVDFYNCIIDCYGNNRHVVAERDGSLDDMRGLEVIFRPMPMDELRSTDSIMRQVIGAAKEGYGVDALPDGYGVHVTTSVNRLPKDHKRRLWDFTYTNAAFSKFIAGRDNAEYASLKYIAPENSEDKYTAIRVRDSQFGRDVWEFRIFKSTTDYNTLLSYAEFITAMIDWTTNPDNVVSGPVAAALFRKWVLASGRYPALASRFTPTPKVLPTCALPSPSLAA